VDLLSFLRPRGSLRTRTSLLNHLVATRGYQRYLEIGVRDPRHNFHRVRAQIKDSVDPAPRRRVKFEMTSDAFFADRSTRADDAPYDLVFIDGLHLAEQVERDVANALQFLAPGGTIVLHDCNPIAESAQIDVYDRGTHWNGTVWKAWVKLRATRHDLSMCVIDIDEGCGVIQRGSQPLIMLPSLDYAAMTYYLLVARRQELLNLISVERFLASEGLNHG